MTYRMIQSYLGGLMDEQIKLRDQWSHLSYAIPQHQTRVKEVYDNKDKLIESYSQEDKEGPYAGIESMIGRLDDSFMQEDGDEGDTLKIKLHRIVSDEIESSYKNGKHDGREMVGMIRAIVRLSGNLELQMAMDELY